MPQTFTQLRLDLAAALAGFLDPREASAECWRWFEEGLGRDRAWLAAHGDEAVPEDVRRQVSTWVRQRKTGLPWSYILGWAPFRGRRFEVSRDTLIPRPETEQTLEAILELGRRRGVARAVDIGTGSGILAITMALETDWEITATDLSESALKVARRNAKRLEARLHIRHGDLLDAVPDYYFADGLGAVVANLPYVDPADAPTLQRELAFEPATALFAPERGLALNEALLRQAFERGAAGAVLELGSGQGAELVRRAKALGWAKARSERDLAGHDRILIAER
ncbi:MAG TPA: peptide chain release factor N(5)-glutamine methyltransferase [Holophagaceae bacterium]|nr:peptide chain release factor N(5)-glutamine methyltransferase [Holophagaceae bacterium]